MKWSRKRKKRMVFLLLGLCVILFCIWQNNSIVITKSVYRNPQIPKEFDGYVIAQISDLHNKEFGSGQRPLLDRLESVSPDLIVITGDLVDSRRYRLDPAMQFVNGAVKIAPVYYVSGNHESRLRQYPEIKSRLTDAGVHVLDDAAEKISIGNSSIELLGLRDPAFADSDDTDGDHTAELAGRLARWSSPDAFQILLCHRPELFSLYTEHHMDLVFTGHAHGGQIRLPFVGGLIAPGQGIFPRYTSGSYTRGATTMVVSRGLGNSLFPVRVFNRPEIVVVTLQSNA